MTYREELRFRQNRFARHVQYLLSFINQNTTFTVSLGRALDIPEVQPILIAKGLSNVLDSMHSKSLAIDINFFNKDYYLFSDQSKKAEDLYSLESVGAYWESLEKENRWGGRWNKPFDPYHFENYFKG